MGPEILYHFQICTCFIFLFIYLFLFTLVSSNFIKQFDLLLCLHFLILCCIWCTIFVVDWERAGSITKPHWLFKWEGPAKRISFQGVWFVIFESGLLTYSNYECLYQIFIPLNTQKHKWVIYLGIKKSLNFLQRS